LVLAWQDFAVASLKDKLSKVESDRVQEHDAHTAIAKLNDKVELRFVPNFVKSLVGALFHPFMTVLAARPALGKPDFEG